MARKAKEEKIEHGFDPKKYDQHMSEVKVTEMLDSNYMPYAMSVIISRALPDVRDGLKPSQRKVLYTMKNMGLRPGNKSKSANIAGTTLRLNPHSDISAYETMVRMVDKNETLLTPFVEGKGSFGKHFSRDMAYAAPRYCVTGDTLVLTDKGIKRIDFLNKCAKDENIDINIKSFMGIVNHSSKVFDSGVQDVYEIKLENGLKIKCTDNHPLLTINKEGIIDWKLVKDLNVGDICVINADSNNTLFGKLDDLEEAKRLAKNINYETKNIPENVFNGTKEYQVTFLRNLFENNGYFRSVKSTFSPANIFVSITFERSFLVDLLVLLSQSFGIIGDIYSFDDKNFNLDIRGVSLEIFAHEIGFISSDKNNMLQRRISKDDTNSYENSNELSKRISEEFNDDTSFFGKKMAEDFRKKYDNKYYYDILSTCGFAKIVSKEYMGKENVYSIKVDSKCHSFVANGFINHNTEASLSKIGMRLFDGIDENAIDMVDNYDGTMKEPSVLPVAFPNILANPTLGIAVGFASNICAFNLKELCEATIMHIKKPKDDLLSVMPAPDFSTGGYILYNKEEILNIYKTGRGSIRLRSKYKIDAKKNRIEIYEIPYSTTAEAIVERVVELCKKGTINEINDIRDDTDKNGLLITIEYKRSCKPEKLMDKLFKLTTLEDTFSCNFNVIVDGNPKCLGVYDILNEWIKFRKDCVVRMLTYEKENLESQLHLLRGLEKILVNIDKAIKIIKNTEKDEDVVPNLMKGFKVDMIQGEYIANIKLRNINKQYILDRTSDIGKIESKIEELAKKIASDTEIKKIINAELTEIAKKYSPARKSEILYDFKEAIFEKEEEKIEEELTIVINKEGCLKKYNRLPNEEIEKFKKDEDILFVQDCNNTEDILVFTDKGNVHKSKLSTIKKDNATSIGTYVNAFCEFEADEHFLYMVLTSDYKKNLFICFDDGHAVIFPIKAYETKQNRKILVKAFSTLNKALIFDVIADDIAADTKKYMTKASNGKALIFSPKDVSFKTTRTSVGATIMNAGKNGKVIECKECSNLPEKMIKEYSSDKYPVSGKILK